MGNCLKLPGSSMIRTGEDSEKQSRRCYDKMATTEKEEDRLLGEKKSVVSSSKVVKIKISKKQLEELLGKIDVEGLSVEQVLSQLMNVSDQYRTQHHRSWRPALQSIPEVN